MAFLCDTMPPFGLSFISQGLTLLSVLILGVAIRKRRSFQAIPYPPGPKPALIYGNNCNIPASNPWITFAEWSREYGEPEELLKICSSDN